MDKDILARFITDMARGDQRALAGLYDATSGSVHALASRMLGDARAAEEALSDVYFSAWRNAARYDAQRAGVLTWLLVMCRSRCLDALRARGSELPSEEEEILEFPAPHDPCAAFDEACMIQAYLAPLTSVQRQLVALAFLRGYSHSEITERTGIPLGSVKSGIRSALRDMRAAAREAESD